MTLRSLRCELKLCGEGRDVVAIGELEPSFDAVFSRIRDSLPEELFSFAAIRDPNASWPGSGFWDFDYECVCGAPSHLVWLAWRWHFELSPDRNLKSDLVMDGSTVCTLFKKETGEFFRDGDNTTHNIQVITKLKCGSEILDRSKLLIVDCKYLRWGKRA